jgi:L-seryl-tRNA(Ser) seleniumtransferase
VARSAGSRPHGPDSPRERLRALPSVEELASKLAEVPHSVAVSAARAAVAARRRVIEGAVEGDAADEGDLEGEARRRAAAMMRPRLAPVINATGVIVHTNLGRAPLAGGAIEAAGAVARGYSNLEYDLGEGRRGSRHAHLEGLLGELAGAEAGMVANNCAAAVLLAVAALAGGREVVVSRGQLIEIGDSFRIPDVVAHSGARLVEVGTTNRTRSSDYEQAIGPDTGAILRAHPSNFRTVGFTEQVTIEELCELGTRAGVPVIDDAGSGALAGGIQALADEPAVRRSVGAGCALVCFSGDKLLGGPQAGVIVGTQAAVEKCGRHPLARAVRPDKLQLAALEATLALYRDPARAARELPVLRMLTAGEEELAERAERMRSELDAAGVAADVRRAAAKAGGGTLPLVELEGPVCAIDPGPVGIDELARRLRRREPAVIGRTREGAFLLDPRTLTDAEAHTAAASVVAALA